MVLDIQSKAMEIIFELERVRGAQIEKTKKMALMAN